MLVDPPTLQLRMYTDCLPVVSPCSSSAVGGGNEAVPSEEDTDNDYSSPRLFSACHGPSSAPLKPWASKGDANGGQFAFPASPHHSGSACSTPSFSDTPRPRSASAASGASDDVTTNRDLCHDGLATIEETLGVGTTAARRYRSATAAPPNIQLPHPRGCFSTGGDASCVVGSWGDAGASNSPSVRVGPSTGGVHRALLRAREVRRSSSDCTPRYQAVQSVTVATATAAATPVQHYTSHRPEPLQPQHFPWPCGARSPLTSPKGSSPSPSAAVSADLPCGRRFSISRAKAVLAECAVGVADRGALVACETGVLSPLLARIRNDGLPPAGSPNGGCCDSTDTMTSPDSTTTVNGSHHPDGGAAPLARRSTDLFPPSSRCSVDAAAASPVTDAPVTLEQRRRHLIDCLDTVTYLAVDAANRSALLAMRAPHLISSKLCTATAAVLGPSAGLVVPTPTGGNVTAAACPAVGTASLRALSGLLRTDAAKADFLGSPGGDALLALLSGSGRCGELQDAAFAAAESLCWSSATTASSCGSASPVGASASYLASSLYGTSHMAAGHTASAAPAPRLLEPRLPSALASGRALHPRTDPAITAGALRLLSLALRSLPQGGSAPTSPRSPMGATVAPDANPQRAALRSWRGIAFALVPLLVDAAMTPYQPAPATSHSTPAPTTAASQASGIHDPRRAVVAAALDLTCAMADRSELASALCAAGALPPTLALLSCDCCNGTSSSASSSIGSSSGSSGAASAGPSVAARAAAAVAAMVRCGGRLSLARLRDEGSLAVLMQAATDTGMTPSARSSLLQALCRAVGDESEGQSPRAAAAAFLQVRGASSALRRAVTDAEAAGHKEVAHCAQEVLTSLTRALPGGQAKAACPPQGRLSEDFGPHSWER